MSRKITGVDGEQTVVTLVPCPNCLKRLMVLPPDYPMYDVQCTGCSFRAQVKTSLERPRPVIYGAGWQIMDKVLKSGYMVPPLIISFVWVSRGSRRHEIRFYPFIPRINLRKRLAKIKAKEGKRKERNYWMFDYIKLDELPYFIVYQK